MKCALGTLPDQFWPLLGQSIDSARIFVISMQTHGAGSDYAIMSEAVKYLHTHHGFSVLCMASGFYDGLKIAENQSPSPLRARIVGSLFRMYANAEELVTLFDYIETHSGSTHELRLTGVDVPMGGLYSKQFMLAELIAYLDTNHIDYTGLSVFFTLCQAYLSLEPVAHVARQQIMQEGFTYLEHAFSATNLPNVNYWQLMLGNLKSRYAFTEFGQARDLQMANNFKYLYESLPKNEKIILWGHASHNLPMEGNFGGIVKSWYGDDVYICHLSGYDGHVINFETGTTTMIPSAARGFVEEKLSSLEIDIALITAIPPRLDCPADIIDLDEDIQIRLLSYSSSCLLNRVFSDADERGLIDALVFTKDIVPTMQIQR